MKNIIKSFVYISLVVAWAVGCTKDFNEMNTNPNGITEEMLKPDFQNVGSYFPQMEQSIYDNFENTHWSYQLQQNLNSDIYSGYMTPPTPFNGGQNNANYFMMNGWNNRSFNILFTQVMKPYMEIKKRAETNFPDFFAVAKILKVASASRTTDLYGPMPYSQYGQGGATVPYDKEADIYASFFVDLKDAVDVLTEYIKKNPGKKPFANFDMLYDGDYLKWVKWANSLRLRLAIRIVKIDPAKAKTEAEAACAHEYGVFTLVTDAAFVQNKGKLMNPLNILNDDYNDTRMGAPMESYLLGYNDPRIAQYFSKCKDIKQGSTVVLSDAYKGIRNGIEINSKSTYEVYSQLGDRWKKEKAMQNPLPLMCTPEVYFLRAEGALRGWNTGSESAQELYEEGIRKSFEQWGVSNPAYITDATSKPIPYIDPLNSANNIEAGSQWLSTITIQWDDAADNETKMERIITQKWIAVFPDGAEAWSEFRRTGYPKLFPVVNNFSGGTIDTEKFIRRLPFLQSEYENNRSEVEKAITYLKGPDTGGTRLWWDVEGPNF